MIKNYFLLALRALRHNRLFSLLNIAGLAVGLATGALVLLWVADEFRYDKFHTKLRDIHLILQNQTQGGVTYTFEVTPGPLAQALRSELPEIKRVARFSWAGQHLIQAGENSFYERGIYAEPDLLDILSFPAVSGDPVAALGEAGSVVITERTALKLFGDVFAVGKILRHNNLEDLKVGAVVRDVPANSTLRFDVLLPFRLYEQLNTRWINSDWNTNSMPTWVELQPGADLGALNRKLENFVQGKNPDAVAHVFAYPLERWRLYGHFKNGKPDGGRIGLLMLMSIIGVFVLLIACINFMNLSTARSERRAREVGVRKAAGASRGVLIGQFLSEALITTFIALSLGLLLTRLALPAFNRFFAKNIALDQSNWQIWVALLVMGLLTGLVAGSYPAFFLSRFQPARVLKGAPAASGRGGGLRKGLVTFQFVISIFLIIATLVIFRQIEHAQTRPLGYNTEQLIEIPARGDMQQKLGVLKNEWLQIPGVTHVSGGTDNLVRFGSNTSGIEWPGKTADQDFLITVTGVASDWVRTTGLTLLAGRDFDPEFAADSMACLLNETAVKRMGLSETAVGTRLIWDTTRTVIGVFRDFVFNDPFDAPAPMAVYLKSGSLSHFFVRFENNEHWRESLTQVEAAVKKYNPNYPFEFHYTDESYQKTFDEMRSVSNLATLFGSLAVFISCLGLFGLSAFVAERRTKEIGIRKVLGATVAGMWFFLSKDFLKPVLLAFVLAVPPTAWLMSEVLSRFEYRIPLDWRIFLLAGGIALTVALATVSFQGIKAALTNPVKSLRNE